MDRFHCAAWSDLGVRLTPISLCDMLRFMQNAYRVLLTRARQGMVIVVPLGDHEDPTRKASFYDPIFDYLQEIGFLVI